MQPVSVRLYKAYYDSYRKDDHVSIYAGTANRLHTRSSLPCPSCVMDLESVFDGPLSTGSLGEKSGKGVSVWQAEVALRLSKSDSHRKESCSKTIPSRYPVVRYIFAIATPISFPMCCCCVTKS